MQTVTLNLTEQGLFLVQSALLKLAIATTEKIGKAVEREDEYEEELLEKKSDQIEELIELCDELEKEFEDEEEEDV